MDELRWWKESKAKFLRDFTPSERLFFLKKAKEAIMEKGYPVSEDLFHYCYFLTLDERLHAMCSGPRDEAVYVRFLLAESKRELEKEVNVFKERLESKKLPVPDIRGYKLIERALLDS